MAFNRVVRLSNAAPGRHPGPRPMHRCIALCHIADRAITVIIKADAYKDQIKVTQKHNRESTQRAFDRESPCYLVYNVYILC